MNSILPNFQELVAVADERKEPVTVVAAGGADETVLKALEMARRKGWVRPLVSGDPDRIRAVANACEISLEGFGILADAPDSAVEAVNAVRSGQARILMKGQIATPTLMKAVLDRSRGLRTDQTIGQVVLMEIERDRRQFLLTDTGITISPTLDQKRSLISQTVEIARNLGCTNPRVALMSATEKVNPALPDTLDAEILVQEAAQGLWKDCRLQGPLSFDLAYAADAGARKEIGGEVTGAADILIFPDLLSANLTVKAIMYTAGCRFGGLLTGTAAPVVFMSRADSVETRLNSLVFALRNTPA